MTTLRRSRLRATFILGPLLAFAAVELRAQDPELERQSPKLEKAKQDDAGRAAAAARDRKAVEGESVSYEEVLKNPDDVELNFRFARQQVAQGNVRGASGTLERILLVNPNLPKVRLFYAIVLYRLDNMPDAERQLVLLQKYEMPATLRAEVDEYLKKIRSRQRRTHVEAALSMGFNYDSNRNAAPATGRREFGNALVAITGASNRRDDTSLLGLLSLGLTRDLASQAGHQLFADLSYYRAEQTLVDTLDLQAYSAAFGGIYKTGIGNFTPSAKFDHIRLHQATFLRTQGGGLRFDRRLSASANGWIEIKDEHQGYQATRDIPTAPERTGNELSLGLGASRQLGPVMRVGASYTRTEKDARKRYNAYSRDALGLDHAWLLGRGRFLLSALTVNLDRYEHPDDAISLKTRRDDTFRARMTFGTPLGFIAGPLNDLLFTAGYEYFHSLSTLETYRYDNGKASMMLSYKWGY